MYFSLVVEEGRASARQVFRPGTGVSSFLKHHLLYTLLVNIHLASIFKCGKGFGQIPLTNIFLSVPGGHTSADGGIYIPTRTGEDSAAFTKLSLETALKPTRRRSFYHLQETQNRLRWVPSVPVISKKNFKSGQ